MSKDWYQQSINALQLNGTGERTQQAYTRALRMLVGFTGARGDLGGRAGRPLPASTQRRSLVE
jgi:hypothetical protein